VTATEGALRPAVRRGHGAAFWGKNLTGASVSRLAKSRPVVDARCVVATTLLADALDPFTGGRLWAFKPFAKDGSMDFLPGAVTMTPLDIMDLACSLTASDLPVTVDTRAIPSRAVDVSSTPVTLAVERQTVD
jgi:hypothetical protein